ncbi:MAG: CcmD family protein [Cytophagales bacterium]|nr:MAG: CcmD family protein [Cytophagales bacterium]
MKKITLLLLSFIAYIVSSYSQSSDVPMADQFRADGKIYVVIAVIGILFLGMLVYLILLDKKISKIEQSINSNK